MAHWALWLMVGPLISLALGGLAFALTDKLWPGKMYEIGDIATSFWCAEAIACMSWAFVLASSLRLLLGSWAGINTRVFMSTLFLVFLVANVFEIVSKVTWDFSVLLPIIVIAEEVASALLLGQSLSSKDRLGRLATEN